jgi:hypothetical protein
MNDNKLIAEFMGVKDEDDGYVFLDGFGYFQLDNKLHCILLDYHRSWEWLMPVSQKIDEYLEDNIGKIGYFDDCLKSNDIDVRYQAVVEFIKWYNENNKDVDM